MLAKATGVAYMLQLLLVSATVTGIVGEKPQVLALQWGPFGRFQGIIDDFANLEDSHDVVWKQIDEFNNMTTAEYEEYSAIVIPDATIAALPSANDCKSGNEILVALSANAPAWGAAATGNVFVAGSVLHPFDNEAPPPFSARQSIAKFVTSSEKNWCPYCRGRMPSKGFYCDSQSGRRTHK